MALGLLVGLQREWVAQKRIGLRSFALISTIGGLVGLFATEYGGWVLASGLLVITIAVFIHTYLVSARSDVSGMTTELAAIAMFLIGALVTSGHMVVAVVLAGLVTLLLHWKTPMHKWVKRIGNVEFEAIGRFVLITLVVLPILPNETYGPYAVLNPWQIWLMVVLIVAINLFGYISFKIASGKSGALVSGIVGGLVSSTATTVSFSKRTRETESMAPAAAIVVLIASALVYVRIIIETAVAAPDLLADLLGPVVTFMAIFIATVAILLLRLHPGEPQAEDASNPAEIKTALSFAFLYAVILFISAFVNENFGESMLYPVAILSGLTDIDAITLSVCRLFAESRIDGDIAWRVIFVASLSNLVFKMGVVALFGGRQLRRRVVPIVACLTLIGCVGLMLWR